MNRKEKCGYTREMYNPEKIGYYLVKKGNEDKDYDICYWDGKRWTSTEVICWTEIPKTDIDTPF